MENKNQLHWYRLFKLNTAILKSVGLWPSENQFYGLNLYTLYAIISFAIFQVANIIFQTVNLYFIMDDLEAVAGTVFVLLSEMEGPLKSYGIFKNIKMLKELISTINHDYFRPKNTRQINMIHNSTWAFITIFAIFAFLSAVFMIFCFSYPFLDGSAREYRLPFLAWYPFNFKTSPQYEMVYVYQIIATCFVAVVVVSIDILIACLNMFIGTQFDILRDDCKHFNKNKEETSEYEKLKHITNHHRQILKFAYSTNQFYNWLLFVQFFVGSFSVGFAMFLLTLVTPFSSFFYTLVFYANAITVQVFMYCWFGNEIQYKSDRLLYSVFESNWIDVNMKTKKALCIFASNVQKPLRMSAFGLFYLSLDTFMRILKTSWSYFALLRQISGAK